MPNLIDNTYFTGELLIPNAMTNNVLNTAYAELAALIDIYEKEYLSEVLGHELADQIPTLNTLFHPLLLKGGGFRDSLGRVNKWQGFTKTNPADNSTSPIAYYVYCKWLANHQSQITSTGAVTPSFDNGARVTNMAKYIWAWNTMVDQNRILHDFLIYYKTGYSKYQGLKIDPYTDSRVGAYNLFYKINRVLL
jgi:hypothetical protein